MAALDAKYIVIIVGTLAQLVESTTGNVVRTDSEENVSAYVARMELSLLEVTE